MPLHSEATAPIFSVDAKHDFFADSACRGLRFVAAVETAALLERIGGVVRAHEGGVTMYAGPLTAAAFARWQAMPDACERLSFVALCDDAGFLNYTANLPSGQRAVPHLRSEFASDEEPDLGSRLHRGEHVIEADAEPLDSPLLKSVVRLQSGLIAPAFVVSIHCRSLAQALASKTCRRYYLRFAARATIWKYVFGGDWDEDIRIVDLDGVAMFDKPQPQLPLGGRPVVSVQSTGPIALKNRPTSRFQLRQGGGDSERVLIKRLPLASASRFGSETSGSTTSLISEIYVNR